MLDNLRELKMSLLDKKEHGYIYYLLLDGIVVYIGKTVTLVPRIKQHRANKQFNSILYSQPISVDILEDVEKEQINLHNPLYNRKENKNKKNFALIGERIIMRDSDFRFPMSSLIDLGKNIFIKETSWNYDFIFDFNNFNYYVDYDKSWKTNGS